MNACIVVGFENGTVRILSSTDLSDQDGPRDVQNNIISSFWKVSSSSITHASFSSCEKFMAVADAAFGVSIFKREGRVSPKKDLQGTGQAIERLAAGKVTYQWNFLGRCQAHYKEIICKIFFLNLSFNIPPDN
jgi:uncharacterized secreted protein with C-terminal beta-propeller domain